VETYFPVFIIEYTKRVFPGVIQDKSPLSRTKVSGVLRVLPGKTIGGKWAKLSGRPQVLVGYHCFLKRKGQGGKYS